MKQKNICKFVTPLTLETLHVSCFVLETNPDTMKMKNQLQEHGLILMAQGKGSVDLDGTVFTVSSGQLVFAFKGEHFSFRPQGVCEYMYILFDGSRATDLFRRFDVGKANRIFDGFSGIIPLWRDSLSRADTETIDLAAESILLYTFSRLSQSAVQKDNLCFKFWRLRKNASVTPTFPWGRSPRNLITTSSTSPTTSRRKKAWAMPSI